MGDRHGVSSVYGPVHSWRVGWSLGVDLIRDISVCSFNCVYCQLGAIQRVTMERGLWVSTEQVAKDFRDSRWREADIVTHSGSGEPTLALNLGEAAAAIRAIAPIPQLVLTNGTLLHLPEVRRDLMAMDRVFVKLDAGTEGGFERVNRPAPGVTLESVIENAVEFRREYPGFLGVQVMLMRRDPRELEGIAEALSRIRPDEAQLNTPTRPYPRNWHVSSRGGHTEELREYESTPLRRLSMEDAEACEAFLRERTGVPIVSVYRKPS